MTPRPFISKINQYQLVTSDTTLHCHADLHDTDQQQTATISWTATIKREFHFQELSFPSPSPHSPMTPYFFFFLPISFLRFSPFLLPPLSPTTLSSSPSSSSSPAPAYDNNQSLKLTVTAVRVLHLRPVLK